MLVSTRTHYLEKEYGIEKAIELIHNCGFEAYDMTFLNLVMDEDSVFNSENCFEYTSKIRKLADDLGIICNQAHAPFPTTTGDPERDVVIYEKILHSIKLSAILGAKIIVVHPIIHLSYEEHKNELFLKNIEFFKSLISYAEKYDIKIAVENIFRWCDGIQKCVGSTAEEMCELIDTINSPYIVTCFDVGHAALFDSDVGKFIRTLGNVRLKALHIHDNNLKSDMHNLPLTQKINYNNCLNALKEIGYSGDFTFEACGFFRQFPLECMEDSLKLMYTLGKKLSERI